MRRTTISDGSEIPSAWAIAARKIAVMLAGHADGSVLLGAGALSTAGRCAVCGGVFGAEPWWVTQHPNGEHTRCRDWSRHPFPFRRQVDVLRRVWKDAHAPPVRAEIAAVGRWLVELEQRWPADGAASVMEAMRRTRKLRAALSEAGVAQKLVNQV